MALDLHVTILSVDKNENAELYNNALEACKWMEQNDKNKDFKFEERAEGGIKIFSPRGRNQAYKRGAYFFARFKINYEVIWV